MTISTHFWYLPFVKGKTLLMPSLDKSVSHACSKFPLELTDGKSGYIFYPIDFFSKLDNPHNFYSAKINLLRGYEFDFLKFIYPQALAKK